MLYTLRKTVRSTILLALFGGSTYQVGAQVSDICVPPIGGLVAAPKMDGIAQNDIGWNGAGQLGIRDVVRGANGQATPSPVRSGSIQYGILGDFLYLSVDLDNGTFTTMGVNDTVVLGFTANRANSLPERNWRLYINPFRTTDVGTGDPIFDTRRPREVRYWHDSGTWNGSDSSSSRGLAFTTNTDRGVVPPPGTIVTSTPGQACNPLQTGQIVVSRNVNRWGLEAKIPVSRVPANQAWPLDECKIYLPAGNTEFRLYANVVSTNDFQIATTNNGTYVEDPWPFGVYMAAGNGLGGVIETSMPDPSTWGVASIDATPGTTTRPACRGVTIQSAGVRLPPTSVIGTTSRALPGNIDTTGFHYLDAANNKLRTAAECDTNLQNGYRWPATDSQAPENIFVASASNNGSQATGVAAKFYIAPWGIPGPQDWDLIGDRYRPTSPNRPLLNPTSPFTTIGAGGSADLSTSWKYSYKESCAYALSNVVGVDAGKPIGHHCVQAELQSTDPNVNFLQKSLQFNHNVVPASRVEHQATIGTRGYAAPSLGASAHQFVLSVDKNAQKYGRDGEYFVRRVDESASGSLLNGASAATGSPGPISSTNFPGGMTEALAVVARAYLGSGKQLVIDGRPYERFDYVGAFSIDAGHNGAVSDWTVDVKPQECPVPIGANECFKKVGNNYQLAIPANSSLSVVTTIEAHEAPLSKFALWLALGTTIPHGSFTNQYDGGFAGTLGFEYLLSPSFSVEATLGRHSFDSKTGVADIDVTQFGVNGKWYLAQSGFKPFVTAGVGGYAIDPGSTRFGGNLGAGLLVDLTQHWSMEGRYTLHGVANNSPNSSYSSLQLGLRYAF